MNLSSYKGPDFNAVFLYENAKVEQFIMRIKAKEDPLLEGEKTGLQVVAVELFSDVKMFLFLCACYGSLTPPPCIQEGWECFLRFPEDYQEFCQKHFNRFIHPHSTLDAHSVSLDELWLEIEDTRMYAVQAFGALSPNWVNFSWKGR